MNPAIIDKSTPASLGAESAGHHGKLNFTADHCSLHQSTLEKQNFDFQSVLGKVFHIQCSRLKSEDAELE
jgi:hypothetical protein